jgi:methyltransferase (TIGR00027 family)
VLDGGRVFPDPLALRIIGKAAAQEIMASPARGESRVSRALRGPLVARSRMAEDSVHSALALGATQYVVLGAGLDTFAYRNPFADGALRVFEVDHPATQRWKRELLEEGGIAVPQSVAFVPVGFETDDLMKQLGLAGFNPALPTVYSWLGVTVYLPEGHVMRTLRAIRESSAAGSMVVFDYVGKPGRWNLLRRAVLAMLSRRFARMGEPWRSFFDERELAQALLAMGYRKVEDARPEDIAKKLFVANGVALKHRKIGRDFGGVMKAWV